MTTLTREFSAPQAAYFDGSWSEWVPCRVVRVEEDETLTIRITATRRGYLKGQTIKGVGQGRVRPRDPQGEGLKRYAGFYRWIN